LAHTHRAKETTVNQHRILMAPSILSADFTHLADAVALVEAAGADVVHVDVMDGHFVPNLTIGPPVIGALKRVTSLPLDVHLMIDDADRTIDWYLDAGADMVTVHVEACYHLHRVLQQIKDSGAKAGVAINPGTPASSIEEVMRYLDYVLVMSVNPGFGGQAFIPSAVDKVAEIALMREEYDVDVTIEVDGGIDIHTAPLVVQAGARMLVAGNAIFGANDPAEALVAIRDAASHAVED
jgi:ribulose-phosphate 3-epimerase